MSKSNELRDLADRIAGQYIDREAIAAGFRLIADQLEATEPVKLDPADNPEAGADTSTSAPAGAEG